MRGGDVTERDVIPADRAGRDLAGRERRGAAGQVACESALTTWAGGLRIEVCVCVCVCVCV